MSRTTTFGVVGGILVAVTVFLSGNTITFDSDALKSTTSLVIFASGLAILAFSLWGRRLYIGYTAMVPGTFALIGVIDLLRSSSLEFEVRLVVLVVGVILAFLAAFAGRR